LAGDRLAERGDSGGAEGMFRELCTAHPLDPFATQARLRLGTWEFRRGFLDRSATWFESEAGVGPGVHAAARYWLAKIAVTRGDSADARTRWTALAHDDSIGYYGLRARELAGLAPLSVGQRTDSLIPSVV